MRHAFHFHGHEHERRHRRGHFGEGRPFGGFEGRGFDGRGLEGRGRGGRARRGDVRAAVLALLAERPMHGYEVIQELAERTNGAWRPSPGSVYPTLGLLQDEGLITGEETAGKRAFTLTETGQAEAAAHTADGKTPWAQLTEGRDTEAARLRDTYRQIGDALRQINHVGTADQKAKAAEVLSDVRRRLYLILADDAPNAAE